MEEKAMLDAALDELHGAKKYIKCAVKHKESHPAWSKKFAEMAQQEYQHADGLYKMAEPSGDRTPLEQTFITELREEYMERCAHVKAMIDAFRA